MRPCIPHTACTTHDRFLMPPSLGFCGLREPGKPRCMPRLHTVDRTFVYRCPVARFLRFESLIFPDYMFPCEQASKSTHTIRNRYNDPNEIREPSSPFGNPQTQKPLSYKQFTLTLNIAHGADTPRDEGVEAACYSSAT